MVKLGRSVPRDQQVLLVLPAHKVLLVLPAPQVRKDRLVRRGL